MKQRKVKLDLESQVAHVLSQVLSNTSHYFFQKREKRVSWKDNTPNSNRFQISARRSVILGEFFVLLCLIPDKHISIDLKIGHDRLFSKLLKIMWWLFLTLLSFVSALSHPVPLLLNT
jgi:hypothetical protein